MSSRPSASAAQVGATTSSTAGAGPGPSGSQGSQNVSQGHFSLRAQHVSIADEKKYRKKYAELASKLRSLEKDNDELVTKYETVKHLLLRLKAEKKILIDVLDKIYEQEEQDNNPIPPQTKDGFTVHALPITTERHVIDKALIVPPHKHQALGITSAPVDPPTSSASAVHGPAPSTIGTAGASASTKRATSVSSAPTSTTNATKQATPAAAVAQSSRKSDSMDIDHRPRSSAHDTGASNAGHYADDTNTEMDASSMLSDSGQHPPPAKRARLAGPTSVPEKSQHATQSQPMRKVGSVASLLDDSTASAPTQPAAATNNGRPSQSPRMRPATTASSHHGYQHPASNQPSAYATSSYSSGGPPPPTAHAHHHLQHHHAAYPDYPPLHSPTGPPSGPPSATGGPGALGPGSYSSRASSASQLSSAASGSSAYPPPAPPGAYAPTTSVPPPSAPPTSRPGPEYFEPAPYRTGAGVPTSPGAYEYHHHHHHHGAPPPHYHHHPPPPPHRPPPGAYAYHAPPPPPPPASAYYDYPPPQQQQQQGQGHGSQPPYGAPGQGYGSGAPRARSPPSANGGGAH